MSDIFGQLAPAPACEHPELLAAPVARTLRTHAPGALVAEIDPAYADTENLCSHYGVPLDASANAVVVRGTRAGTERFAVCMTLATRRVDVNGVVRRRLEARKASFAPMDVAVAATGMEYGGITPVGAPEDWPVWVDARVAAQSWLCIGSGIRSSKLFLPADELVGLPGAVVVEDLAR
ncbi:MAG: YbaK/EbsC family protein [Propioniciclava sp.]